jgi:hypothetical protein
VFKNISSPILCSRKRKLNINISISWPQMFPGDMFPSRVQRDIAMGSRAGSIAGFQGRVQVKANHKSNFKFGYNAKDGFALTGDVDNTAHQAHQKKQAVV